MTSGGLLLCFPCGDERSPELLEGHLHQVEYGRCERDAGTFGNQNELLEMARQIITTCFRANISGGNIQMCRFKGQMLHGRKESVALFNPVPVVLQTTTDVARYTRAVCERHFDHRPHQSLWAALKGEWQFVTVCPTIQNKGKPWWQNGHVWISGKIQEIKRGMSSWEKNQGKKAALWAAGLNFQECIWLRPRSSERSAVTGAPALFQGPQGGKRGKRGNRESWARVWLAEVV